MLGHDEISTTLALEGVIPETKGPFLGKLDGAHYSSGPFTKNEKASKGPGTIPDGPGPEEELPETDIEKLALWNGIVPKRINRCVHNLITDRCLQQPNAPAVCAWDGDFTYQELDELSTGLAIQLVRDSVAKPETFVPIFFEKSRWTTVAILGVLKSGSAFVLLDPSHPFSRLKGICEDVGASGIVASAQNTELARGLAKTVITVENEEPPSRNTSADLLEEVSVGPDNAAYAVFTSGSTGKPKAAVIEHGAYCTAATAHSQALFLTGTSRVFQFASYAFDVSISDNLMTLIAGGCICVPSETDRRSNMSKAARDLKIDRAELTPSVARLLSAADIPTLKTLVLGGEAMSAGDVAMWADQVQLFNTYGPSECCVNSTIKSTVGVDSEPKNIGHGSGCVCWVVDPHDHQRLIPIGATGELLVEGPIVGREYLNEPAKTAAAFVHNPKWLKKFRPAGYKGQLYKTGDLVKYEPDGSICYVGRKDTQVKIRGQRVELGEVEHHVHQHFADARDVLAEVVAPTEEGRSPYLATFILRDTDNVENVELFHQPSENFQSIVTKVRQELSEELPSFMVPAVFLPLSHVPLTPTGKTDRRKLRGKAALLTSNQLAAYSASTVEKQAPSTEPEKKLHSALCRVLNVQPETVGVNDDFFQLGGDSITAMELANVVRNEGIELSVGDIFGHPKLFDMAAACREAGSDKIFEHNFAQHSLVDIADYKSFIRNNVPPGSPLNERNVLDILPVTDFQETCIRDMPCTYLLLDIHGNIDVDQLRAACMTLVQTHSALRTMFLPYGNSFVQVILDQVGVSFLRYGPETDLQELVKTFFRNELANVSICSPLVEFTLVQRDTRTHSLIIRLSHAQFDGLSVPLLYNGLATAYSGKPIGEIVPFSGYVHQCFTRRTAAAFDFWRALLHGSSMTRLDMGNNCRPALSEHPSINVASRVDTAKPPVGITMATVVKAAWALSLAKLTSETDIVFGQLVNGRSSSTLGLESVIGACLNYIPVRVKLRPQWTALNVLHELQGQHIQTLVHETTGLSDIVRNCTKWEHNTEFGSTVQYQNIDEHPRVSSGGVDFVGAGYVHEERPQCIRILAFPHEDQLEIKLAAPRQIMDKETAQKTVSLLCNCVSKILGDPEGPLLM